MKISRIVFFFLFAFGSIILPVAGGFIYSALTYEPPYVIKQQADSTAGNVIKSLQNAPRIIQVRKIETNAYPGAIKGFEINLSQQGNVLLIQFEETSDPEDWMHPVSFAIPTTRVFSSKVTEYTRQDNGMKGLLFHSGSWLIKSEAKKRDLCYLQLAEIPILQAVGMKDGEVPAGINLQLLFGSIALYCIILLITWPRAASWAAAIDPAINVSAVSPGTLRTQLLAINAEDIPFTVEPAKSGNDLIATWKYADARWAGIMATGGMSSTASIRIRIDDKKQRVRVIDRSIKINWAASAAGSFKASVNASIFRGITFFNYDSGMVAGIIVSADGKPSLQPSYSWKFDLNEMRNPLIGIVVNSGWKWQPVITFLRIFN